MMLDGWWYGIIEIGLTFGGRPICFVIVSACPTAFAFFRRFFGGPTCSSALCSPSSGAGGSKHLMN